MSVAGTDTRFRAQCQQQERIQSPVSVAGTVTRFSANVSSRIGYRVQGPVSLAGTDAEFRAQCQ